MTTKIIRAGSLDRPVELGDRIVIEDEHWKVLEIDGPNYQVRNERGENCTLTVVSGEVGEASAGLRHVPHHAIDLDGSSLDGLQNRGVIRRYCAETGSARCPAPQGDQGFVTSMGRFVNRVVAHAIAREAGQFLKGKGHGVGLFSEDVW